MEKRVKEIDVLRGIFCIYVLLIHCTGTPSSELIPFSLSSIVISIVNISCKGAILGFIFLSGLSLSIGYKDKDLNVYSFYKKRVKTVLIPYIGYTLIYYIYRILVEGSEFSLHYLIARLLDGNMYYHLYFMIIIIQFYVIYPIVNKIVHKFNKELILFISVVINILCFIYIPKSYRFLGNYLVYFMLGVYMGYSYDKVICLLNKYRRSFLILLVVATLYYIVEFYLEGKMGITLNPKGFTWELFGLVVLPGYYILSQILLKRFTIISNILIDLSKVSMTVYLVHPIILDILKRNIVVLHNSLVLKYLTITIYVLFLAISYSKIAKQYKKRY